MKKISCSQFGSLIYLISLSSCLGNTANTLIDVANQDSWMSIFVSGIVGFIPFYVIIKLLEFKPELNIFEKNHYIFGKLIGNIINILLVLMFIFIAGAALWDLNNFISSQYLHKTPSLLIGIFMTITIIYLLTKDLFVMARTCFILFLIGFGLYFLGFIGLVSQIKLDRIMPILENGLIPPIKAGLMAVTYDILPLFVLTVIPKDKIDIKKTTNLFKWFYFSGLVIFIIIFLIVSIFGYKLAAMYEYPAFHLLKNISLFGFFERVESIISLRWIFYLMTLILMSIYFGLEFIKKTFKINSKKIINLIIIIFSLLILILSEYIFTNNTAKEYFMTNYFPYLSGFILGVIPIIIYIFSRFKKTI